MSPESSGTRTAPGLRARLLWGAVLVCALALCAAGAWSYARARGDADLAYGRARDTALAQGRTAIAALSTLDASTERRARAGVERWQAVTTGPLRTRLGKEKPETGPVSRGVVTDAAVTALDDRAGTAKLIATVRVETKAEGTGSPSADRRRLEAVLARTADGTWKVKSLNAVPVTGVAGASGASGASEASEAPRASGVSG
ncbi:hypothetical protein QIS99_08550 [Streptomyces sp. B-S-A8]|uniref:Mce-associated membrane protein n=1 Tax=Streptomyces solicavernae TaxID=3043614 RepID=A0ABT6RP99_9ACTN|nr:hypothetical protein [Streptomyces sp. B-S-A8]MDI3386264.1 hypothetical protein [Streptomyces sp. B-S-A8]